MSSGSPGVVSDDDATAVAPFKPGDRVYVTCPGLAELRRQMRRFGYDPAPNHHGTVDEVTDGLVRICFDSEDGPGQGQTAPYPPDQVRRLTDGGGDE